MRKLTDLPAKTRLALAAVALLGLAAFVWQSAFHEVAFSQAALIGLAAVGVVLLALVVGVVYLNVNQFILRKGGTDPDWLIFPADPPGLQKLRSDLKQRSGAPSSAAR